MKIKNIFIVASAFATLSAYAMPQELNSSIDPTKIGFAAKLDNITGKGKYAFAPYYTNDKKSIEQACVDSDRVYQTTVVPILQKSPNSTLQEVWDNYEAYNCNSGITKLIVSAIRNSQKSINVAAYDLNNPDIVYALVQQKKDYPKIQITVIADKANLKNTNSMVEVLKQNGIKVYISSAYSIMHNKFMIFDDTAVEFGSFNYSTTAATVQANDAIYLENKKIAQLYQERFDEILKNEKTAEYNESQSTYSQLPFDTGNQTAVTDKTSAGDQIYNFSTKDTSVAVVQTLASREDTISCPDIVKSIGGECLANFYIDSASKPHDQKSPLLELIKSAKKSIHIAIFSMTDQDIADALIDAYHRGVDVKIVVDNYQGTSKWSKPILSQLQSAGIEVRLNKKYSMMHDKYMIVDDKTLETGSYNFSKSAQWSNAENYQIYYNQEQLAKAHEEDWQELFYQAEPNFNF